MQFAMEFVVGQGFGQTPGHFNRGSEINTMSGLGSQQAERNSQMSLPIWVLRAISFNAGRISLYAGTHIRLDVLPSCGFGHKVKLAHYWNQQLTRTIPA